ncbi:MAG: hypothetical protein J6T06_10620, partial [Victivallales bacterium]|nr:hypothetical protein [Victivallales bacterium]
VAGSDWRIGLCLLALQELKAWETRASARPVTQERDPPENIYKRRRKYEKESAVEDAVDIDCAWGDRLLSASR